VARDPSLTPQPHRSDLRLPYVEPGRPLTTPGVDTNCHKQVDEHLLERTDVGPQVAARYGHDGIAHQLPRRVQRGGAPPFGRQNRDAAVFHESRRHHVAGAPAAAQCDDGFMFKKEQDSRQRPSGYSGAQFRLQGLRGQVRDSAEVEDGEGLPDTRWSVRLWSAHEPKESTP